MNLGIETETIEFKRTTAELREGIVSLSSMINKNGYGKLYFGVRNDGDITGQELGDGTLRDISQAIANHIKPQIIPTISLELIENKNVISVYAEGNNRPDSAYGKYYIRSADEDRELSPEQLKDIMLHNNSSDVIVAMTSYEQDLQFTQLKMLYASKAISVNSDTFEQNLGLKTGSKYNMMASLLADNADISIKVVSFSGRDKTNIIRRNEYGYKCLILAMEQVLNYVESLNETAVFIGAAQREEIQLFDMSSFREAWVNACLHTRWERNNPPAVYIYSDRIEVISTGGLPKDLSRDEFFRGISRPINHKLQKIFGQLGYVEQTGHGVPLIVSNYGKQAFELSDNYINVVIPFSKSAMRKETEVTLSAKTGITLNKSQRAVIEMLREHPEYTINQIVDNSDFSNGYVRKILAYLEEHKLVRHVGSRKTGQWEVNSGLYLR